VTSLHTQWALPSLDSSYDARLEDRQRSPVTVQMNHRLRRVRSAAQKREADEKFARFFEFVHHTTLPVWSWRRKKLELIYVPARIDCQIVLGIPKLFQSRRSWSEFRRFFLADGEAAGQDVFHIHLRVCLALKERVW